MLRNSPTRKKSRLLLAAAFAVAMLLLWLLWYEAAEAPLSQEGVTVPALTASLPTRLVIPEAQIAATFGAPLGLLETGEIEVPADFEAVGYYQHGPMPGEQGPAVVLGHVDSYEGPAVFYSLGELQPGDEILIEREDGTTAVFAVERLERHTQAGFPTTAVYGDLAYPGLRLITCSGVYDSERARYSHNLIVFARLVAVR